jgi:plastocyanin
MKKITQLLLLVILLLGGRLATAATVFITVADFSFSPSNVTINPGDVVQFQWSSGNHTSTSDNGVWNFALNSSSPTQTLNNLTSIRTIATFTVRQGE